MKKMSKSTQIQANGGWGVICTVCGWHATSPVGKSVLQVMCASHNQIYPGHNAHVC